VAERSEMRQNTITGEWAIYAPARAQRPHDLRPQARITPDLPAYDPQCPFCPGNEHQLPPIIMEMLAVSGETERPWQTRVVRNKYPVLAADAAPRRVDRGVYAVTGARGRHEVLIETARHNEDLTHMSLEAVGAVIETYHRRYTARAKGEALTLLFRNRGPRAGASLLHPHSQLIALSIVPPHVERQEAGARDFYNRQERCGYCEMLAQELAEGQRVVLKNTSFVAFVPYAATVSYEMWIVPRRHAADFGAIDEAEKSDLAAALREALRRLRDRAGDPEYNYVIHTATRAAAGAPYLHWYLQIRPRVAIEAGFEIESGVRINASLPEDDAVALRGP
jgi:UDPglucose--hexose-1-phosphate uridylyltransferase